MAFTVPARRAEILSTHVAPIAGYLNGDNSTDYEQTVSRFGNSSSTYADQVTQLDTTNGYIARFGYGSRGSQTWMLDITKNKVVMRNGVLYCQGPYRYDVEAYASSSDLNSQGVFECDTSIVSAANLCFAAVRSATIIAGSGSSSSWPYGREVVFNSPVAKADAPINATKIINCIVRGSPQTALFSGDSFASAGAYDSGVDGSGTTVTAANSPMFDVTGCQGTKFIGLSMRAQLISGVSLGPATTAPTVKPGCGWLVSSTESYSASWANNANSNNLTFELCDALGWFTSSPWVCQNTQINTWEECGSQQYYDASTARGFWLARNVLNSVDSAFYPNPSVAASGDERMARTALVASDCTFRRCEFHDMVKSYAGTSDAQSALTGTIGLDGVYNVKFFGGPQSSSGRAHVELLNDCRGLTFDGVEFYDDGDGIGTHAGNTKPSYILYNNSLSSSSPAQDVIFRNCWLNTAVATALIGGTGAAQFKRLMWTNNRPTGTPTLMSLTAGYSGASDYALTGRCEIHCGGLTVTIGSAGNGGTGPGVEFFEAGTVTVSGTKTHRIVDNTTGVYRSPNNVVTLAAETAAGATMSLVATDSSDNATFGNGSNVTSAALRGSAGANLVVGSSIIAAASSTGLAVTGTLTGSTYISGGGGTLPSSGEGRWANNTYQKWRGSGGAAISVIGLSASDILEIGQTASLSGVTINAANTVKLQQSGTSLLSITGNNVEVGTAALSTSATTGFFCIPSCAGAATGAVSPTSGLVAMVYDSTNNQIYVRSGGTWRKTAALT